LVRNWLYPVPAINT